MKKFKIFNDFGITPTKNFEAAGYDFYIPNIKIENNEQLLKIFEIFAKSYKISVDDINVLYNRILFYISAEYENYTDNSSIVNIMHLFLAVQSEFLPNIEYRFSDDIDKYINIFIDEILILKNDLIGINLNCQTYLLFNSGIKVKLNKNTAGIFFNKSGKGNQGLDTRACVVDEDYTGYVHLSIAYDKIWNPIELYCGDKISQMVIVELEKNEIEEVNESKYENLQNESTRGDSGFGSSDIKH